MAFFQSKRSGVNTSARNAIELTDVKISKKEQFNGGNIEIKPVNVNAIEAGKCTGFGVLCRFYDASMHSSARRFFVPKA